MTEFTEEEERIIIELVLDHLSEHLYPIIKSIYLENKYPVKKDPVVLQSILNKLLK